MSSNQLLLSVIIPVYNVEQYLERCVNSLISNCSENYEIILVDDGSKDSSPQLCDSLALSNPSLIKVIHKENGGLSSARNSALDIVTGDYVFFLDSDDCVDYRFFEILVPILEKRLYDIVEIGSFWERELNVINPKVTNSYIELSSKQSIECLLKNKIGNQICFRLFKRELFNDIRFPIGRNYEDIASCYKLIIKSEKVARVDAQLYIYNITNADSITKSVSIKNMTDMYNAVNELAEGVSDFCKINGIDTQYIEYNKRHQYIYIYIKLQTDELKKTPLYSSIKSYLAANNRYNILKYRHYDLKRWLYYEFMHFFKKM